MVTHSSLLVGKSHGQRSLEGYSPWSRKESDMTEHTHTHTQNLYSVSFLASEGFLMLPANLDKYPLCSYCEPKAPYRI